ncbi:MAG: hypothetical protein M1834_005916 [Cirrosporium novae-zelandiae]|nr:MAG: hypothetical protein M1834_005916 [Cirrosporium novae-zelandiae]
MASEYFELDPDGDVTLAMLRQCEENEDKPSGKSSQSDKAIEGISNDKSIVKARDASKPTEEGGDLNDKLDVDFDDYIVPWMWISWVFKFRDDFLSTTSYAMHQSNGIFDVIDFPLPRSIVGSINYAREEAFRRFISFSVNLLQSYQFGSKTICSDECDSMVLGGLTRCFAELHILVTPSPYEGQSFSELGSRLNACKKVLSFCSYVKELGLLEKKRQQMGNYDYHDEDQKVKGVPSKCRDINLLLKGEVAFISGSLGGLHIW